MVEFKAAAVVFEGSDLGDHGEGEADFFETAARRGGGSVGSLADGVEGGQVERIGVVGGESGVAVSGPNDLLSLLEEERGAKAVPEFREAVEASNFDAEFGSNEDTGLTIGHPVDEPLDELFALVWREVEQFGVGADFARGPGNWL